MKLQPVSADYDGERAFSALGRAVWDETSPPPFPPCVVPEAFSALGRAVWDETIHHPVTPAQRSIFQCSRSSRMG